MLYFLFVAVCVTAFFFFLKWKERDYGWRSAAYYLSFVVFLLFLFAVVLCSCGMISVQLTAKSEVAEMEQTYRSLTTQLEEGFYTNENEVGRQAFCAQVQEWNEDLARNKSLQRDFWLGIFTPNIYDQFQYIPLTKASLGEQEAA